MPNINRFLILFLVGCLTLLSVTPTLAQGRKLRVYLFAGQSNCTGAGAKVAKYPIDLDGWKSPFIFKMMRTVKYDNDGNPINSPNDESSWFKNSGTNGIELNGKTRVGTRVSHLLYPFHSLFRPENTRRLEAALRKDYREAHKVFANQGETHDFHSFRRPESDPLHGFNSFVGPEIEFARLMRERHTDSDVAIIKISAGATTIQEWEPPARLWESRPPGVSRGEARNAVSYLLFYKHLQHVLNYGMETLAALPDRQNPDVNRYSEVELAGFIWIQGESDLYNYHMDPVQADADYKESFTRMVRALRHWYNPRLPFVISRTKGFIGIDVYWEDDRFVRSDRVLNLQQTQMELADDDLYGTWVNTNDMPHRVHPNGAIDPGHWNSAGQVILARRIFQALRAME